MDLDRLASALAESLARHQSRGLVDTAGTLSDVVIHGRVDLLAVAEELVAATLDQLPPQRKSWSGWFVRRADGRRTHQRNLMAREKLFNELENASMPIDTALARLRLREQGYDSRPG